MLTYRRFIPAFLLCGLLFQTLLAQNSTTGENSVSIPLSSDVVTGKLSNGITYYIQKNAEPANRMELRLAVNAGSMQENDKQQGLAHFVEHMAFNGTKHFEKQEIVDYLESIGTKFGAHLNAYTSFDETVYMLQAPTDDPQIIDKTFLILSDWASEVSFDTEEINKERGVVIEEWRLGQGANERMRKEWWPVQFKDSRYANRLPIGKKDILENFDPQLVRDFYNTWYRPELMAVIAVGDFDVAAIEKQIKEKFGKIPASSGKVPEKQLYPVPAQDGLRVAVASDPEARFARVQLSYMQPAMEVSTEEDYRQYLQYRLAETMINNRLSEYANQPNASFNYGFGNYGSQVRTRDQFTLMGITSADNIERCLRDLMAENKRLAAYGFSESELDRAKKQVMTSLESRMKEQNKQASRRIAMEYVYHYLKNDPVPGIAYEYQFAKAYMKQLSLNSVNESMQKLLQSNDRVVVVTGPQKEGVEYPTESGIRNMFKAVDQLEVSRYEDNAKDEPLVSEMAQPGSIVEEKSLDAYGATEWMLSNGAKVIFKSTDYKNDQILFSAVSEGGYSKHDLSVMWSARNADGVVNSAGLGNFDQTELRKKLAGVNAYLYPYISAYEEGLSGRTSPDDLETFMQMVHLYFTAPRKDADALEIYKQRAMTFLENQAKSPEGYYRLKMSEILSQNHPWSQSLDEEGLSKIELDEAYKVFKERFASPSDFTFVFVGNVQPEQLKGFVNQYLASIPEGNAGETYEDLGIRPPKGKVEETIYKGSEPKSAVTLVFSGKYKAKKFNSLAPKALEKALTIKLRQALREEQGGTYGVRCRVSIADVPYENYQITISFGCAPENAESLKELALSEIEKLRDEGPTEEDLQKFKETAKREHEQALEQNNFWMNRLENYASDGSDATTPAEFNEKLEELEQKEVRKIARKLLNTKKYISIVLMPEEE